MAETRMKINKASAVDFFSKFLSPTKARFLINSDGSENFGFSALSIQGAASYALDMSVSDSKVFGILALAQKGSDEGDYAYIGDSVSGVKTATVYGDSVSHFHVNKPYEFDAALECAASISLGIAQGASESMSVIIATGGLE